MGKKLKSKAEEMAGAVPVGAVGFPFAADGDAVDPSLASLFDKSVSCHYVHAFLVSTSTHGAKVAAGYSGSWPN